MGDQHNGQEAQQAIETHEAKAGVQVSNFAADDTQAIARRLRELEAEKNEALTGSSAPVTGQEQKTEELPSGYGDYLGGMCGVVTADEFARAYEYWKGAVWEMKSLAHPEWPYAGTPHAWRGFVNQK